jgi:hypothetical protein
MMLTIELPWPSADLTPNGGVKKWDKIRATKAAKAYGLYMTKSLLGPLVITKGSFVGQISVQYTFHPAVERGRDDDNFTSRMKPYRDGIALALGVNDKHFKTLTPIFAPAVKGCAQKVIVTLTPALISLEKRGFIR